MGHNPSPAIQYHVLAAELPSMIATLHSYEAMFGPYHLQTLALTAQVARALWSAGEACPAQRLLEHSAQHLARYGDQASPVRISALATLRDLLVERNEIEKAAAVQREIVECRTRLRGPDHPQVADERAGLARMLLSITPREAAA
jgi:hypothetical protein